MSKKKSPKDVIKEMKVRTGVMLSRFKSSIFKSAKEKYKYDRNFQKKIDRNSNEW